MPVRFRSFIFVFQLFILIHGSLFSQKKYVSSSVLSRGDWFKLAVSQRGIYKIDASMLMGMGLKLPVSSSAIRLFGNGGSMLPEDNASKRVDDLTELSIWVNDGGDGSVGGSDYLLFFAPGTEEWKWNTSEERFTHTNNFYSDSIYYFLTVGGEGLRIQSRPYDASASLTVNTYDALFFHELDSINLLSSGKQWYGEEFGSGGGQLKSKKWVLPFQKIIPGEQIIWATEVLARSSGQPSTFNLNLNGKLLNQISVAPLNGVAYEPIANQSRNVSRLNIEQSVATLEIGFNPGGFNAQGWLDKIEFQCRHELVYPSTGQLSFRDRKSMGSGNVIFNISNIYQDAILWDVTDFKNPVANELIRNGTTISFSAQTDILREYVSAIPESYLTPIIHGSIQNQDLHGNSNVDYIIVTAPQFREQAEILGKHHQQKEGLSYVVVDVQQVFNEFSSGQADPAAIRDFIKMQYDRAAGSADPKPKYLLLFGAGSFDPKNRIKGNINYIPTYQSDYSLDPLTTYTSDDFFGFLDDFENINSGVLINKLDIGVGRIPARNIEEANNYINKILTYATSFGPWRNQLTLVADDEDQNIHLQDAEELSNSLKTLSPGTNIGKVYLDAYDQVSGLSGAKYPSVNDAINRRIYSGNLIWNYSGHGGYARLAQESILEKQMVDGWLNEKKLPMFVTASCDFAPYDNPLLNSLGENILLRPKTGAIALLTTTRLVFAASNKVMNRNFMDASLKRNTDGSFTALGEVLMHSKNITYENSSDVLNNRKFTLLGDPALKIGFPAGIVKTTFINGISVSEFTDTLKALNKYNFSGIILHPDGKTNEGFNGYIYITIYDKRRLVETKGNDPGSIKVSFENQQNMILNAKTEVRNGIFTTDLVIPKDIDLKPGKGKISYYAHNEVEDAAGFDTTIYIGGLGNSLKDDGQGPVVRAYLNDEMFVNGGLTNERPVLIVKLKDSSGLNITGLGVGHDITATLDGNYSNVFILNDFYESDAGSKSGTIRFPLPKIEDGNHKLVIKVWDIFNNSTEYLLEFQVANSEEFKIDHVLNYPNPFTTKTSFWFEHNRPNEALEVNIRILTITGKVVKTIRSTIFSPGNRLVQLEWNGGDEFGAKVGRGIYIYQLTVKTRDGKIKTFQEKLAML